MTITTGVVIWAAVACLVCIARWGILFFTSRYFQSTPIQPVGEAVSIVICARNARELLARYLPHWLAQQYPNFEVIVVDDASSDGTAEWLEAYRKQYPHLNVYRITDKRLPGKKQALALGVSKAKHDWVFMTDADCDPASPQTIRHIMQAAAQADVVLGIAPFYTQAGLLNAFCRYELQWIARLYVTAAYLQKPYMAVGRNWAMRKAVFNAVFPAVLNTSTVSGDDDLTVQNLPNTARIATVIEPEAWVYSEAPQTISAYWNIKRRHFTTGFLYKPAMQWALGAERFVAWLSACWLIVGWIYIDWPLALSYAVGLFLPLWMYAPAKISKIGGKDLRILYPLLDLIYNFVQPMVVIFAARYPKNKWN